MPEHHDQRNERERGDTRYQVQKGCLRSLTHAIFHSLNRQNIATVGTFASGKASFRKSRNHLASKRLIVKCLFSRQNRP